MSRPRKWRCLEGLPGARAFTPAGVPLRDLPRVHVTFDELETMRLLHVEGLTQAEAGTRLGVSASTVSRMAERAHRAVTEALVCGRALVVEGGPVTVVRLQERRSGPCSTSAETEDARSKIPEATKGATMVIAVPYLQGNVNAHFGSTQAFLLAQTAGGAVQETSVYAVQGMQHNHAGIAGFLKEQGVTVILAGGMGGPMQQALKAQGFELYCGVSGDAVEAVERFLRGEIEQSESTCGHHHGG